MSVDTQSARAVPPLRCQQTRSSKGELSGSRGFPSGQLGSPKQAACAGADRPQRPSGPGSRRGSGGHRSNSRPSNTANRPDAEILFQKYFKSIGPRTYAAQIKKAGNGNQFLVLTEAKRDSKTGELRKTRLYVYSEDFVSFFRMLHETAQFIRDNPLPEEFRKRRERFWAKKDAER